MSKWDHEVLPRMHLIHAIIQKYRKPSTCPYYDELVQAGVIGCISAFEKDRGNDDVPTDAWVSMNIRWEVLQYLRKKDKTKPEIPYDFNDDFDEDGTKKYMHAISIDKYDFEEEGSFEEKLSLMSFDDILSVNATITERERSILTLRYRDGRLLPDIGKELGMSGSNAQKLSASGIRKLRRTLSVQAAQAA